MKNFIIAKIIGKKYLRKLLAKNFKSNLKIMELSTIL